jgi:hypothetical protein
MDTQVPIACDFRRLITECSSTWPWLSASAKTMSCLKDPNAFADPEDSELVRKNKRQITESMPYNYTEVLTPVWCVVPYSNELSSSAMWYSITSVLVRQKRNFSGHLKATRTSKRCPRLGSFPAWLLSSTSHLTFCPTSILYAVFLRTGAVSAE